MYLIFWFFFLKKNKFVFSSITSALNSFGWKRDAIAKTYKEHLEGKGHWIRLKLEDLLNIMEIYNQTISYDKGSN